MRAGLAVLAGAHEVAGVDGGGGEVPGLAGVAAVSRAPDIAGIGTVGVGGGVAHLLEGVAAVAEVLGAVGDELELAGLHLGAVLGGLEVAQLRGELVDGAVEAAHLGVERVDEAPHEALALVGELGAVRPHTLRQHAEGFAHRVEGVVAVPDVAGVELVALGGCAIEGGVLADGRGYGLPGGLGGIEVLDGGHVDLLDDRIARSGPIPDVMVLWDTRAQRSHRGRKA